MRIGIDARMYSSNFTGIGRYTYELLHHLLEIDKENEYVVFVNKEGKDHFKAPNERVKVVYVNAKHYSFAEQTRFLLDIKKAKVDLMHFTHFNAPIMYRGKSVVTIHDLTLSFFPGEKMNTYLHRWAYNRVLNSSTRKAAQIIAVSNNTKKDLVKVLGVPEEKINVIYEAVDDHFNNTHDYDKELELREKYGLGRKFFLYTGVWREHKNIVGLITAFDVFLKHTAHKDIELVLTGRDDPKYKYVKDVSVQKGIGDKVKFLGLVPEEELPHLYRLAYAYVFPSFYEGFGLPPLEAMASGTPVVASNVSCIPEICGEGNALYFDPYSIFDMAEKMDKVAYDQRLYNELIDKGVEHVKQFSWRKMAEETLAVYKKALQS